MATNLRTFADLTPYRAAVEQEKARQTPEGQLAMAIQEAVLAKNQQALQASDPNSQENQLALAIQQANLAKIQRPQVFEVNGSLVTQDPTAPDGYRSVFTAPKAEAKAQLRNIPGVGLVEIDPSSEAGYRTLVPSVQEDPWQNPIQTDQGLIQINKMTGATRPFTLGGEALKPNTPIKEVTSPWGDPIQTDQGLVQRNKLTGEFRNAQLGEISADVSEKRTPLTRTSGKSGKSAKLSEDEKKMLLSAVSQSKIIPKMVDEYRELAKKNLAGPVAGKVQRVRGATGYGSKEFSAAQAKNKGNLFKLARALQGAGVLTEQDITRMESIAPPLDVSDSQFVGGMQGVASLMHDNLESFLELNGGRLDADAFSSVRNAQEQLNQFINPEIKNSDEKATTSTASSIIKTQEEFNKLNSGDRFQEEEGGKFYTKP